MSRRTQDSEEAPGSHHSGTSRQAISFTKVGWSPHSLRQQRSQCFLPLQFNHDIVKMKASLFCLADFWSARMCQNIIYPSFRGHRLCVFYCEKLLATCLGHECFISILSMGSEGILMGALALPGSPGVCVKHKAEPLTLSSGNCLLTSSLTSHKTSRGQILACQGW